ncbi:MAG TPA: hypothetical protein VJR89_13120, partial [Polyangiales bacterium]|nr:hypothetical protein [Polyangiales bacterium]
LREGAAQLTGTLELRNATQASIRGARLSLRAVDRELATQALPEIAPGAVLAVPVTLAAQGLSAVTATVSYELDARYASVEAVVPLVLTAAGGGAAKALPDGYAETLQAAESKHAAGEWQAALVSYRQADALYSNGRTLQGLGMVELDLGDYAAARQHLEAALRATQQPLAAEQRALVQRLLRRAQESARGERRVL